MLEAITVLSLALIFTIANLCCVWVRLRAVERLIGDPSYHAGAGDECILFRLNNPKPEYMHDAWNGKCFKVKDAVQALADHEGVKFNTEYRPEKHVVTVVKKFT